jgi:hypothetical protein
MQDCDKGEEKEVEEHDTSSIENDIRDDNCDDVDDDCWRWCWSTDKVCYLFYSPHSMTRAAAFELITDYVENEILGNGERRNGRRRRAKSMAKIKEKLLGQKRSEEILC